MGRWRKGLRSGAGGGEEKAGRRRDGEASAEAALLRKLRGVWEEEAAAREAVVERILFGKKWAGGVDGRLAAFQRKSSGIVRRADPHVIRWRVSVGVLVSVRADCTAPVVAPRGAGWGGEAPRGAARWRPCTTWNLIA
jgi:hypothetical protein